MSRIEKAINDVRVLKDKQISNIDIEVGRLKREARLNETLVTGQTVSSVVSSLISVAEELTNSILTTYESNKKWVFVLKSKYSKTFARRAEDQFYEFIEYCYVILKETTISTCQPHLYDKEYPNLQNKLESFARRIRTI